MSIEILPSARLTHARENLANFVRRAKHSVAAFGHDLPFDDPVWDVTSSQIRRVSAAHKNAALYFTTHAGGENPNMNGRTPLAEPFASFLKAMVRIREENGHVDAQVHATLIRAGRYLYEATELRGHDPVQFLLEDFNEAVRLCKKREMPGSQYRVGVALERIAKCLNQYRLSKVPVDFKSPCRRIAHSDTRIGKEADDRRAAKLPSEAALDALARIANLAKEPSDVLRIRVLELLSCGGWRINELLTIPANCEVFDEVVRNGAPVLGSDGRPLVRYGIRYFGLKKSQPQPKWVPTEMIDVAKRAIADIRRITSPAREALAWMDANPGRALLPEPWREHPLDARYTSTEISQGFGLSGYCAANELVRRWNIPCLVEGRRWTYSRASLEAALAARVPQVPRSDVPLKAHEYMFVMPVNWAHRTRGVIDSRIEFVTDQQISDFVTGRAGVATVCARFGFKEDDGSPIKITSHQFRHYLNTLQQQGGMSQMEIARWSGRKDIGQNAEYDHLTGIELAEKAREMLAKGRVHGPVAAVAERLPPVRRSEFLEIQFVTAHTTDLGMCANDWSLTPCNAHGACASCVQHLIIKGRADQRQRALTMLEETTHLLQLAGAEVADETYGASNYVAHHRKTVAALEKIVGIHSDPDIPDGDLVNLDLTCEGCRGQPLKEMKNAA
jgi:hypothetical protein